MTLFADQPEESRPSSQELLKKLGIENKDWWTWDFTRAQENSELARAVSDFAAYSGGPAGRTVASQAEHWLKELAFYDTSTVTHVLLHEEKVAAFCSLLSGEAIIEDGNSRDAMKIKCGSKVGTTHVHWIARANDAPPGAGQEALLFAMSVAQALAQYEGKVLFTLDPYDVETSAMWSKRGFKETDTPTSHSDDLRRLCLPIVTSIGSSLPLRT